MKDSKGVSPITIAARNSQPGAIPLLTAAGANPDAVNGFGWTAAHYAKDLGHDHVLTKLAFECRGRLDVASLSGDTPTHRAARMDRGNCFQVIYESGVGIFARNKTGKSAVNIAAECRSNEVRAVLRETGISGQF